MLEFKLGQRVVVHRVRSRNDGQLVALDIAGTVTRLRRIDKGAFIKLDHRAAMPGIHNFPIGDTRERDVLAYPEHCNPSDASN